MIIIIIVVFLDQLVSEHQLTLSRLMSPGALFAPEFGTRETIFLFFVRPQRSTIAIGWPQPSRCRCRGRRDGRGRRRVERWNDHIRFHMLHNDGTLGLPIVTTNDHDGFPAGRKKPTDAALEGTGAPLLIHLLVTERSDWLAPVSAVFTVEELSRGMSEWSFSALDFAEVRAELLW